MRDRMSALDRSILRYLVTVGLLEEAPKTHPGGRVVLSKSACFVHGGDNRNALLVYADGWACETKGCHRKGMGCNLPGLIRSIASRVCGKDLDWQSAWAFVQEHVS